MAYRALSDEWVAVCVPRDEHKLTAECITDAHAAVVPLDAYRILALQMPLVKMNGRDDTGPPAIDVLYVIPDFWNFATFVCHGDSFPAVLILPLLQGHRSK